MTEIRPLAAADAGTFQSLRLQGLHECPGAFAASPEDEAALPPEEVVRRLAPQPGQKVVLGAFVDDQLVGLTGLMRESMTKLRHKAFVWGVYVTPSARRGGVARALMTQALAIARDEFGVRQVLLGVNERNTGALVLYQRLGFEVFGRERGFLLLDDGVPQHELHMVRYFTPPGD